MYNHYILAWNLQYSNINPIVSASFVVLSV